MKASLKKIMNGLSAQYAGEYLSAANKSNVLGERSVTARVRPERNQKLTASKTGSARIAMLCSDATNQKVVNYILENSSDCQVDILYHGIPNTIASGSFYKQAKHSFVENNIDIRFVKLISDSFSDVKDYLTQQGTLKYLVTDSKDNLINDFLNNKMYKGQVNVPIVLIK